MQKYVEIFIDNDSEKKYRYFALRDEKEARKAEKYPYYDFEVITGERISHYDSWSESWKESPMYVTKYPYDVFNTYYYSYFKEDEFFSIESFEDLKTKTSNNVPVFRRFLEYCRVENISAVEIKEYLQEIEKSGLLNEYYNYLKELVMKNQREYVTVLAPYYEKIKEEERVTKEEEDRQKEAEKYIFSLRKIINNNKK